MLEEYKNKFKEFDVKHETTDIILLGKDGAIRRFILKWNVNTKK